MLFRSVPARLLGGRLGQRRVQAVVVADGTLRCGELHGSIHRCRCAKCGKPCRRKKKFYQTLSPFNKNAQGLRKTASEIREELTAEYRKWLETTPLTHVKCED